MQDNQIKILRYHMNSRISIIENFSRHEFDRLGTQIKYFLLLINLLLGKSKKKGLRMHVYPKKKVLRLIQNNI